MARNKRISAKLIQQEKDRIANPDRGLRDHPITATEEKLHNQLRRQRRSILAERQAQRRAAQQAAQQATNPKPGVAPKATNSSPKPKVGMGDVHVIEKRPKPTSVSMPDPDKFKLSGDVVGPKKRSTGYAQGPAGYRYAPPKKGKPSKSTRKPGRGQR